MPKIEKEAIDALNATVTVTIEKEDYEAQFEEELQKYRKNVSLKGFRKGKTPANVLRKMYGKSVLAEVIDKMVQKEIFGYIEDQKIEILGQPLPSEDNIPNDLDVKDLQDFVFKFDLGIAPQFELKGISPEDTYERYAVEIPANLVEEDFAGLRARMGERVSAEGNIQEGDFVKFDAKELAGDALKEGGLETNFEIPMNEIQNESFKAELFTKKIGDTLRANIYELFNEPDEHYIRHHLLKLDHDDHDTQIGQEFELTIAEASRYEASELNQDFFDKAFGPGKVSNEEEAKAEIRKDIEVFYNKQADALLFRDIQERLMEVNELPLPDGFLKRWLKAANEKLSDEMIERDYETFAKNLKWTLLKNKLSRHFDIDISEQDIRESFAQRVREYFGSYGMPDLVDAAVDRLMKDQKQINEVYEDLLVDKLHEAITGIVTLVPKPIEREAFMGVLEEARAKARVEQESPVMDLEEEE
ncbi:MAG: trigger factor [Saprospiraceae bacterium]|nr:trigger factor [Saprospiraceae bacterium]